MPSLTSEAPGDGSLARLRGIAPAALLVVMAAGIGVVAPSFATLNTLAVTLSDTSVLFMLAAGMTFVIMLGGIDLSVQSVASFASVLVATMLPTLRFAAFPAAVLCGLICWPDQRLRPCAAAHPVLSWPHWQPAAS